MNDTSLLFLPPELILRHILSRLRLPDLISVGGVCRALNHIISSSVWIQYMMELERRGMVDNPLCSYFSVPPEKRLEILVESSRRWDTLDWKWKKDLTLPIAVSKIYGTNDGILVAPQCSEDSEEINGLYTLKLPIGEGDIPVWRALDLQSVILGFGFAMDQDLMVCVTRNSQTSQAIHFIQYSKNQRHPLASVPIIDWNTKCSTSDAEVEVLIRGRCAVILMASDDAGRSFLILMDWKSGEFMLQIDTKAFRNSIVFLSDDLLLWSNSSTALIEVYRLRVSDDTEATNPREGDHLILVGAFKLPSLTHQRNGFHSMKLSSSIPSSKSGNIDLPFIYDPSQALVVCTATIEDQSFSFVIPVDTFLQHLTSTENSEPEHNPKTIAWEQWGPRGCRLFRWYYEMRDKPAGSMRVSSGNEGLELQQFGRWQVQRERYRRVCPGQGKTRETSPYTNSNDKLHIRFFDWDEPTIIALWNSPFTTELQTCLPYVSIRRVGKSTPYTFGYFPDERRIGAQTSISDTWDQVGIFGFV